MIGEYLPERGQPISPNKTCRWMCKGCGNTWYGTKTPRLACICGSEIFFRDCNIVLVGKTRERLEAAAFKWRVAWAKKMRARHAAA